MKTLPANVETRVDSSLAPRGSARAPSAGSTLAARWLYLKQMLAHPKQMASIFPASRVLCERIASHVRVEPGEWLVELGPGTGAVTQALLDGGASLDRTAVIEIGDELAQHVRRSFPGLKVITGDAMDLGQLLPPGAVGRVGTIVCGIPLAMVPLDVQRRLVDAMFSVMPEGRYFLQYSYFVTSPLKARELGLKAERLDYVLQNVPFASIWAYRKA
ncbi:class I SAM-dependent methyltransferase [Zavarzinia sp. CC-PAN008]|uniref:class I SAM-dependent methyltransferase n=1 Tax=Zavarzinia sp. CC-PAN008 TaxID=3243332 RepID=UPI003F74A07A